MAPLPETAPGLWSAPLQDAPLPPGAGNGLPVPSINGPKLRYRTVNTAPSTDAPDDMLGNTLDHAIGGHGAPKADTMARKTTMTLVELGVVYGDIGTSPLYALRESALAAGHYVAI